MTVKARDKKNVEDKYCATYCNNLAPFYGPSTPNFLVRPSVGSVERKTCQLVEMLKRQG